MAEVAEAPTQCYSRHVVGISVPPGLEAHTVAESKEFLVSCTLMKCSTV